MFIEEIMLQKDGMPIEFPDGTIMCRVVTDTGEKQVHRFAKDVLIKAGVLEAVAEKEDDIPQVDGLLGMCSILFDEQEDSLAREKTNNVEEEPTNKNFKKKSQRVENENPTESSGWSDANTTALLDKYADYMDAVGPMERFKNKKCMWEQIPADFAADDIHKNPSQCENRFKTVKKRKTIATTNNNTSGAKRVRVEYEEEMRKIASKDDSIEPEILQSADRIIVNTPNKVVQSKPEQYRNKLANVLLRIHDEKQATAKERHEEKMELLKNLAESLKQQDSLR